MKNNLYQLRHHPIYVYNDKILVRCRPVDNTSRPVDNTRARVLWSTLYRGLQQQLMSKSDKVVKMVVDILFAIRV
jgi:hypothetical protein